jgi:hypothetical protein
MGLARRQPPGDCNRQRQGTLRRNAETERRETNTEKQRSYATRSNPHPSPSQTGSRAASSPPRAGRNFLRDCEVDHIRGFAVGAISRLPDGVSQFQCPGWARPPALYCARRSCFFDPRLVFSLTGPRPVLPKDWPLFLRPGDERSGVEACAGRSLVICPPRHSLLNAKSRRLEKSIDDR